MTTKPSSIQALCFAFKPSARRGIKASGWCCALLAAIFAGIHAGNAAAYGRHAERASNAAVANGGVVTDLPLAGGLFQRVLYLPPEGAPRGTMVMFPGGAGDIDIRKDGSLKQTDNFVVRTRDLWRSRGYGVVLVDAIGRQSMRGQRSTSAYAEVTRDIIAFARSQGPLPVWVLGTSQGSIAAMNAASHAGPDLIAGVVLTESVSVLGGSHETVFDAHPGQVRTPALVVANEEDRCSVAPPSKAEAIARSMRATHATVLRVSGGVKQSKDDCGSLTPHGYYGIEDSVVSQILNWMQSSP